MAGIFRIVRQTFLGGLCQCLEGCQRGPQLMGGVADKIPADGFQPALPGKILHQDERCPRH
jgi:hypothetical protein